MKTKTRRDTDGNYKYVDTSKCKWGITPSNSSCGFMKCDKQCLVVLTPNEYVKNLPLYAYYISTYGIKEFGATEQTPRSYVYFIAHAKSVAEFIRRLDDCPTFDSGYISETTLRKNIVEIEQEKSMCQSIYKGLREVVVDDCLYVVQDMTKKPLIKYTVDNVATQIVENKTL